MVFFSRISLFGLLAAGAWAAPSKIARRAIDEATFAKLELFGQYSSASYCSNNFNSTGDKITCDGGNCPLVEAAGATSVHEFENSEAYGGVTGYIAVDTTNKAIVLAFRGSSNLKNWLANLNFPLIDFTDICEGCQVHRGFLEAWNAVAEDVTAKVKETQESNPDFSLVFTGHSHGAALAAVGATIFRKAGDAVELVNYGQPRIGNMELMEYITKESADSTFRVTHTNDIVCKVPPKALGFHHFAPEYFITSGDNTTVTTADVEAITEIDSDKGNAGADGTTTEAHRWYFVTMSGCD